jgi:hypothetical protein
VVDKVNSGTDLGTALVQSFDPVYWILEGYGNEATDFQNGCPWDVIAGDALEGIGGLVSTAGIAAGGAGLVGGFSGGAAASELGAGEVGFDSMANGLPKTSPNFKPPTNAPQMPPSNIPAGWRVREMPPTSDYPNGYWKLEKPMGNGGWQAIDPSTMKPGGRPETHVPFPAGS